MNSTKIDVTRECVYPVQVRLIVWECPSCGIVYGVPEYFANALREVGGGYYCPNGHRLRWSETDADKERKRAERAERELRFSQDALTREQDRAERERRTAVALRGHLTRMRNRISNGVCPVPGCKRSGFTNVMRHVAAKHPAWHHEHADEIRP